MKMTFVRCRWFISITLVVASSCAICQENGVMRSGVIDSIFEIIRTTRLDAKTKSHLADSAFRLSMLQHDQCRQVHARVLQAVELDALGLLDSALQQLMWAQRQFQARCDSASLLLLYGNLTAVYLSLNEYNKIDSVYNMAMGLWNDAWQDRDAKYILRINKGIADVIQGDTSGGQFLFESVLQEARQKQHSRFEQKALINLGSLKGMQEDLDSAFYYFNMAASLSLQNLDITTYMDLQHNLASIEIDRGRYAASLIRLDSLFALAKRQQNFQIIANTHFTRSRLYSKMKDYEKALHSMDLYVEQQEAILNEQRIKAVTEMQEKYESEKKINQIKDLEVKNLDATLKNERISNTRNRFMYAGAGILLIAIGSLGRLQYVRRAKHAIQKEKDISEGLLLNILPATVAEELKVNGRAKAKSYDLATILFSDFKNFTAISSEMSAEDIVDEINVCFQAFDEIMAQYGLEKIKTIGDAYMAAGAVPDDNKAEAQDVIHAALAMQEFIIARKKIRDEQHQAGFEMRIGIHTGPVVAGIVGVKKFQYDLWGDTVNIASRMETYSEPGYVNISATTYELVKNDPSLTFTPRGMIEVKGKGEMMMYFVSRQQQAVA